MPSETFWLLLPVAVLAANRLVRLLIVDELGRRLITDPLYGFLLNRLPERHNWTASSLHCPWCLGFWIHAITILTLHTATITSGPWITAWTIPAVILAAHWIGTHIAEKLGEYDEPQDTDDDNH